MSWSLSTGVVDKLGAETAVNKLMITDKPTPDVGRDSAVFDQLQAAKRAALDNLERPRKGKKC